MMFQVKLSFCYRSQKLKIIVKQFENNLNEELGFGGIFELDPIPC